MYTKNEQICAPFLLCYTLSISLIYTNPLPILCYVSSLSPSNPAHMCERLRSSTIVGKPPVAISSTRLILSKKLFTANISSVWYRAQRSIIYCPRSRLVFGFILYRSYASNSGRHELVIVPAMPQQQDSISRHDSLFSSSQSFYLLLHSVPWVLVIWGLIQMPCLELSTEPLILSTLTHCDSPH